MGDCLYAYRGLVFNVYSDAARVTRNKELDLGRGLLAVSAHVFRFARHS